MEVKPVLIVKPGTRDLVYVLLITTGYRRGEYVRAPVPEDCVQYFPNDYNRVVDWALRTGYTVDTTEEPK